MTKPRVTVADRLSNIFEVIELGRRSGLLTVERGAHSSLEQGEVYFSQGRATYAMVEGLAGRDALSVLAGWGQCRFAFDPAAPARASNIAAPQPAPQAPTHKAASGATGVNGAPTQFNWNAPSNRPLPDSLTPPTYSGSHPGQHPGASSGSSTPSAISWPTNWPSSASNSTGQLSWPAPTGALPSALPGSSQASTPSQTTGPFTGGGVVSPDVLERRPRRAPDVRDLMSVVSAYNLSRNHRTILLLADGDHTVLDIARLSSKPVDEIVALLADLERRGLVYYF